ncbi:hypothetical protein YTPLAS73_11270 [Nitrosarchaeum sp.]|nr:hypothetical protein YTPLAS73_11270 [Nitrosarchaeum sp.]
MQIVLVVIGTLITSFVVCILFSLEENTKNTENDFPNWLTLVVEIAVGFVIAIIVNYRTKKSETVIKGTLEMIKKISIIQYNEKVNRRRYLLMGLNEITGSLITHSGLLRKELEIKPENKDDETKFNQKIHSKLLQSHMKRMSIPDFRDKIFMDEFLIQDIELVIESYSWIKDSLSEEKDVSLNDYDSFEKNISKLDKTIKNEIKFLDSQQGFVGI